MNINMNSISPSFGATIVNTKGSTEVDKMLNTASLYDYSLSKFTDYRDLCARINEILPDQQDIVSFKKAQGILDDKVTYIVDGSIIHNKKTIPFTIVTYGINGSYAVGKRIIDSIKKAINKK